MIQSWTEGFDLIFLPLIGTDATVDFAKAPIDTAPGSLHLSHSLAFPLQEKIPSLMPGEADTSTSVVFLYLRAKSS